MNSENLQNQLDRIEALLKIQVADTSALLFLLGDLTENLPDGEKKRKEMEEMFLKIRKKFLHSQLEHLENTQPEKAARIQELIDKSCNLFPFDYE